MHPKDMKSVSWGDVCTSLFIAETFTTAKIFNQSKCLLMDKWAKRMWYTPIYYPALKKGSRYLDNLGKPEGY